MVSRSKATLEYGGAVASARAATGMSQAALAERAAISASMLAKIERGLRLPSEAIAKRLAAAVDVELPDVPTEEVRQSRPHRERPPSPEPASARPRPESPDSGASTEVDHLVVLDKGQVEVLGPGGPVAVAVVDLGVLDDPEADLPEVAMEMVAGLRMLPPALLRAAAARITAAAIRASRS